METELFQSMVMRISTEGSTGGGHIYDYEKKRSICGIENRFPWMERDMGAAEEDEGFKSWLRINEPWICRTCLKGYKRRAASIQKTIANK